MNKGRLKKRLCLVLAAALLLSVSLGIPVTWAETSALPQLNAQAAILIEQASGKVLWGVNQNQRLYPASTTKIMTAMLALEALSPDDKITLPDDFVNAGETGLALVGGTTQTAEELLMAMMLYSANDAAQAIAIGVAGSEQAFVEQMNQRAAEMGLQNTHFVNPHGLHNDNHYTSAYDLAMIARAALYDPEFRRIINTPSYTIKHLNGGEDYQVFNRNGLLTQYAAADGVKTGYTRQAGNCFVASATENDMQLVVVLLNSSDIYADASALLDWGFANYSPTLILEANTVKGSVAVQNGGRSEVAVLTEKPLYFISSPGEAADLTEKIDLPTSVNAPVHRGEVVGSITYTDANGDTYGTNLLATRDVGKYSLRLVIRQSFQSVWQVFVVPFS